MLAITYTCAEYLKIFAPNSVLLKLECHPAWLLGELMEYEDNGGIYDASRGDMVNSELIEYLKQFGIHCNDVSSVLTLSNRKDVLNIN